ncbi:TBC1 domain family member 5 [Naviculisporaceae sp. PSN 640]
MRSLDEAKSRWEATVTTRESVGELRRAIKFDGSANPCQTGCRSVCWKAFLLFRDEAPANWSKILRESRDFYSLVCAEHLRFIKHPEQLTALSIDPLADDPDSPWDALRNDELVRAEILQDVRRLPDEPFYHEEAVQTMILDILFLYCKLNPPMGGYRQGMHELLAPIVYVVAQDAIDRNAIAVGDAVDPAMVDMLDSYFIEHDAYALFSKVMGRASTFYEVGSGPGSTASERNTIVEKSKHIHEVALMKIDPELANHLQNIEVLPQIFLIRWIRLLFSREFPFEDLLAFWDALFAFDPDLELIDLICVSMLLRVRWTLLEADYSVALQMLLKYPAPQPPHGPHTFVDDALYLRNHSNAAGGVTLIFKYTGKSPATVPTPKPSTRPTSTAPSFQGFGSLRQRTLGARSPLASSTRLLQQQRVETLLQGAAKGVLERGEKLGINQAVRDAMGEIRRNVQGLQESRSPGRRSRGTSGGDDNRHLDLEFMERRNRQLAAMLNESVNALKQLTSSVLSDTEEQAQVIDLTAARIQFVKTCLEDSSITLPDEDVPPIGRLSISSPEVRSPTVALDTTPVVMTSSAVEETRTSLSRGPSPESKELDGILPPVQEENSQAVQPAAEEVADKMETDVPEPFPRLPKPDLQETKPEIISPQPASTATTTKPDPSPPPKQTIQPSSSPAPQERPHGPIPTRSTLAQSSFSWMLEPDVTPVSAPFTSTNTGSFRTPTSPPRAGGGKKRGNSINPARERNAFLFGEVTTSDPLSHGGDSGDRKLSADEIFGLQPLRKAG